MSSKISGFFSKLALFVAVIACFTLYGLYESKLEWENNLKESVTILIKPGTSRLDIGKILKRHHLIEDEYFFFGYTKIIQSQKNLKAGEYEFFPKEKFTDIVRKITEGEVKIRKITIPEGLTSYQIQKILENEDAAMGNVPVISEEGIVFPDTYHFSYGETKNEIYQKMRAKMDEVLNSLSDKINPESNISDVKKLVILASIIEKEAKLDEEKPIIASVFLNRLKIGMPLQSDPTALYAITHGRSVELGRMPRGEDMKIDSPYNTYKVKGLPPGAIGSPGLGALKAALFPADTNYLYFVTDGKSGKHIFSESYEEHLKNIRLIAESNKNGN
ncbi:MAG: endolytic transglycosylase MltG [Rickettsiaceae bacterium]|nr:endolytic transglycosylase MltG [Rickettsiaceae bacterium]